jgi:hypothetical protein
MKTRSPAKDSVSPRSDDLSRAQKSKGRSGRAGDQNLGEPDRELPSKAAPRSEKKEEADAAPSQSASEPSAKSSSESPVDHFKFIIPRHQLFPEERAELEAREALEGRLDPQYPIIKNREQTRQEKEDIGLSRWTSQPARRFKPLLDADTFGPLPLIAGENPKAYLALLTEGFESIEPKNLFEEFWVRDFVDHAWEATRLGRLKSQILQAAAVNEIAATLQQPSEAIAVEKLFRRGAAGDARFLRGAAARLVSAGVNVDGVFATAFLEKIGLMTRIDRLLAETETRRNAVLRSIKRHRKNFGQFLAGRTRKYPGIGIMVVGTPPQRQIPTQRIAMSEDALGSPPLIPGEEPSKYIALSNLIVDSIGGTEGFEATWVANIADIVWEARRLHRYKKQIFQRCPFMGGNEANVVTPDNRLRRAGSHKQALGRNKPDGPLFADADETTTALNARLDEIESLNQMIDAAETRRALTLDSIHRYRQIRIKYAPKDTD